MRAVRLHVRCTMSEPDWFVPRAEWEALGWEWVPDHCPTINAIIDEIERDKTATGTGVFKS